MFVHLQEHKHRIKILINQTETKLNINRWIFSARPSDWTNLPIWALYQVLVYPCQVGHFYYELLIPSTPWVGWATQQSGEVSEEFNKWYLGRFPIPGSHPGGTTVALARLHIIYLSRDFVRELPTGADLAPPHIIGSVSWYQQRFCKQTNNQTQTIPPLTEFVFCL